MRVFSGIVAVFCLAIAVQANGDGPLSCGYTFQGQTINLSALMVSGAQDYVTTDSSGYTYDFNVCAASTTKIANCQQAEAAICQSQNSNFVSNVAKWPASGTPSGFSMIDPTDLSKGVQLQFDNGDMCFPTSSPRTASIQFVCGSAPVGAYSIANVGCNYTIVFPTSYACVAGPSPPKPASFSPPPQYVSDVILTGNGFTQTAQAQYQDVNKDGFVDLVYSVYRSDSPSQSVNQVYLNNGTAWVQANSGAWKSPVPIDRAIALIRSHYQAGFLNRKDYRGLMVLCAHPKYRSGVEVLHSNFAADGSEEGETEFMELALEYLSAVNKDGHQLQSNN